MNLMNIIKIENMKNIMEFEIGANVHYYFRDSASSVMEGIIDLHNIAMYYLIVVVIVVGWNMMVSILYFSTQRLSEENKEEVLYSKFSHDSELEFFWTLIPAVILVLIGIPSFGLLYIMDEASDPVHFGIRVIGHQWYWHYTYTNINGVKVDYESYIVDDADLELGDLRLLEVDSGIVVPVRGRVRYCVTSADVLHSFSIPALGLKVDAVPGRVNQVIRVAKRCGVFYGQCSEICGVNHGFMPIRLEVCRDELFFDYIKSWENI